MRDKRKFTDSEGAGVMIAVRGSLASRARHGPPRAHVLS